MAKPFDPKAKAKRQKIIAGVLGLVLVGVLAFQAPKIMSMFGGGSSTTATEPATATPPAQAAPTPATPGAPASTTPAPAAGGTPSLLDSDPAPVPSDGQLVTFDRFESKDPFVPQVSDDSTGQAPTPSAPTGGDAKPAEPQQQNGGSAASSAGGATSSTQPAPPQVSNMASIAVNGTKHVVSPGGSFPEERPDLPAHVPQEGDGQGGHCRRRLRERRADDHAQKGRKAGHADEHRGRDDLCSPVRGLNPPRSGLGPFRRKGGW